MSSKNEWFTCPASSEDGRTIIVTGRLDVESYRARERNNIRVEVTLPYEAEGEFGFPSEADAELMEKITDAFNAALKGKNTALLTGIYTGGGERNWVFYTFSTESFGGFLNRALAAFPQLPLKIYAENDPEWAEYDEMRAICATAADAAAMGDDADEDF
ncbi:MAG: DUF695 domain-containing protein [Muribaculaceae bacterium]|jgi:hypothetical protein|nr:DUF695 domain-containing protein [Muribaculaceae bacterium]